MKQTKQKIIKVGNSLAVTIPASFVKDGNLAVGDEVLVAGQLNIDAAPIPGEKDLYITRSDNVATVVRGRE